ncbi:TetR family transcriptional regulator [Dickeya chrysanthemi]|nr:TetR family transcriptional regulator [Dickeya chrysanthemi]WJM87697.1 TetR family transcriptional regulator [Dickeya chrysanthemi]
MDLLVKTSGVARKSIYRYFATKDDVAAAALAAFWRDAAIARSRGGRRHGTRRPHRLGTDGHRRVGAGAPCLNPRRL